MSTVSIQDTSFGNKVKDYTYSYVCQPEENDLTGQYLISFFVGFIFGPWSWGIIWLLLYFIVYWLVDYIISRNRPNCWNTVGRAGIFFASLLGFIVSRTLYGVKVLKRGKLPFQKEEDHSD